MENDALSGSVPNPRANPAVQEAARTLGRQSAKAIRGTRAAKERAAKAGKHSWDSRMRQAYDAGYDDRDRGTDRELGWRDWSESQARLKKFADQVAAVQKKASDLVRNPPPRIGF